MFVKIPKDHHYLMIKKFFTIFLLFINFFIETQYTEIINSNRPGFSESPYSVGTGVYQFETSLFFRRTPIKSMFSNPQALGLQLHFRTSFFLEKLELNLTTSLQRDKIAFRNVFESSYNQTGLGELTLGAKYLVYEPKYTEKGKEIRSWNKRHGFDLKRWIPNVAVYAGVNFNSFLTEYHNRTGISPKAGVLLQNDFSKQFNLITNIYYNYIGSELPEWSYIITGTYNFNDTWAGFAEHQAMFNEEEQRSNLGLGLAYLYNNNLQFNTSLRATFQEQSIGFYASLGASYRIDRHIDEFVELDEFGNRIEDGDTETYKKGFFGRLFDKIKGIFKKKEDKIDVDTKEGEKTEKEPSGRKRQKSVLDDIIKKDKKDKKKKTKEEKKAERKKQKEIEREERRIEKEKRKEEKKKQKEIERLEKEEKRLARELERMEKEKAIEDEIDRRFKEDERKRKAKEKEKKSKDDKNKENN